MRQAGRRGLRSVALAFSAPATVRCAIYTRKSTDVGLDRDFNSLDAQREIAESYIASQRHEGWVALPSRYDDGGYSGANTNRPALKRLLADIDAGLIDCVVVYRYDRLSRDLLDFLQMLNSRGVEFVSVSERFDTSTPHGEMALNMVLSVAQCERKVIGQRTSDKICAARRRGKWTGGWPPLGYDVVEEGGALKVNSSEAIQVRTIFKLYTELGSVMAVVEELNRRGWVTKAWRTKTGKNQEGRSWTKKTLHKLLVDQRYIGKQTLGGEAFEGEHEAIVPTSLFEDAQRQLEANRSNGGAGARNRYGALLRGLVRCSVCDSPMAHTVTRRRSRPYRYYRCTASMKRGASTCSTKSVSAPKIEAFVVDQIRRIGLDVDLQRETFEQALAQTEAELRGLKAEALRLKRDLAAAGKKTKSLAAALAETTGPARTPVQSELEKVQKQIETIEKRQVAIGEHKVYLQAQTTDQADVARSLEAFDPIWDVLLTAEKERVLRLLIEKISYSGQTGELDIVWKLGGFGEFAKEIGDAEP